jgi:predicted glycosyltransferase
MSAAAFIYVQHLLGIGHLRRAMALARACAETGMQVTLASGGQVGPGSAPAGVRVVQLPAARAADLGFRTLLDAQGREIDDAWKQARAAALLQAWQAAKADVLVLELFPFGRRQMRFELLPLLEAAAAAPRRPAIVCSVRDILGGLKGADKQQEAVDLVGRYFDRVLVHGDARGVPFEQSFPPAARIASHIAYTGYVVEPARRDSEAGKDEVIVSAGGGAVGAPLLEAAIRAKPLSALRAHRWRVLGGDNLPEDDRRRLSDLAAAVGGIVFERSRADFTTLLANCALSISQAGYNTLLETVQANARAVVVPFARGNETEQTLRARAFAARGAVEMVEEPELTPQALAAAMERAMKRPAPVGAIDLDGARRSAALLAELAAERAAMNAA